MMTILAVVMTIVKIVPTQSAKENNQQSQTLFRKVYEKENYISTFKASENKLKRLDVLFKNPNLESRDEIEIILMEGQKELLRNSYNGYNFGDTSHARIDFPPIANSKNTEYSLVVRELKKVDGKLELGVKNDEINFIQYYGENLSIFEAVKVSLLNLYEIAKTQTVVLAVPVFLLGALLW